MACFQELPQYKRRDLRRLHRGITWGLFLDGRPSPHELAAIQQGTPLYVEAAYLRGTSGFSRSIRDSMAVLTEAHGWKCTYYKWCDAVVIEALPA